MRGVILSFSPSLEGRFPAFSPSLEGRGLRGGWSRF